MSIRRYQYLVTCFFCLLSAPLMAHGLSIAVPQDYRAVPFLLMAHSGGEQGEVINLMPWPEEECARRAVIVLQSSAVIVTERSQGEFYQAEGFKNLRLLETSSSATDQYGALSMWSTHAEPDRLRHLTELAGRVDIATEELVSAQNQNDTMEQIKIASARYFGLTLSSEQARAWLDAYADMRASGTLEVALN